MLATFQPAFQTQGVAGLSTFLMPRLTQPLRKNKPVKHSSQSPRLIATKRSEEGELRWGVPAIDRYLSQHFPSNPLHNYINCKCFLKLSIPPASIFKWPAQRRRGLGTRSSCQCPPTPTPYLAIDGPLGTSVKGLLGFFKTPSLGREQGEWRSQRSYWSILLTC